MPVAVGRGGQEPREDLASARRQFSPAIGLKVGGDELAIHRKHLDAQLLGHCCIAKKHGAICAAKAKATWVVAISCRGPHIATRSCYATRAGEPPPDPGSGQQGLSQLSNHRSHCESSKYLPMSPRHVFPIGVLLVK
eukprot:2855417-Prymnesium_polylepis.1